MAGITDSVLGFGLAFYLRDEFTSVASRIQSKMDALGMDSEKTMRTVNKSLSMMKTGAAMVATSVAGLSLFKKGADVRAEFQAYEVQFETLLGSAEKAQDMFNKIKQDAQDNPIFGTKSLVAANAAMLATKKISEEGARSITNNLAEIIAGVGGGDEELSRMAVNLQGIIGNNKVTGMDMRQFVTAGIPVWTLLEEATGKTQAELEKTNITAEMLSDAFAKATAEGGMFYGATERAAQSTKGLKAAMEDATEMGLERLGKAIEPITRKIYASIGGIMDTVSKFLDTPIGQKLAQITAYLLGIVGAIGVLITVMGAARIGTIFFNLAIKSSVIWQRAAITTTDTLSTKFIKLGRAAWASLGPYALIAAAIAAVIWVVVKLKEGFDNLQKPLDKMEKSGVVGFFTKVAAVLELIKQVFGSWDGSSATFTEELAQKLEALGLGDYVDMIVDFAVKLREFWNGIMEGLQPLWEAIKEFGDFMAGIFSDIWETIKDTFGGIFDTIAEVFGLLFGTTKSEGSTSLGFWHDLGHIIGTVLTTAFKVMASVLKVVWSVVSVVFKAIMWVVKWLVKGIIWLVGIWVQGFKKVIQFWTWLGKGIASVISWVWDKLKGWWEETKALFNFIVDWLWQWIEPFWNIGSSIVSGIWDGIVSMWDGLVEWVSNAVDALVDTIMKPIQDMWNWFWDIEDEGVKTEADIKKKVEVEGSFLNATRAQRSSIDPNSFHQDSSKMPVYINPQQAFTNNIQPAPITVNLTMDGDKIANKVIEKQDFKNNRRN
nr:MAG TPA: tail tape measure protein [Herelleviridae sp.]